MQLVSTETMKSMITHGGLRLHRPLAFWGPPGVGKSDTVRQAARDHGAVLVDIRLSQYESVDLRGIPDIQTGKTVWNVPVTVPFKGNDKFDEDGPPIFLFLDEINTAEPSTFAVAMQLCLDRRVGEHILMDNVVILAAGNRDQDRGATSRFPAPLANRFIHAEVEAQISAWSKWARGAGIPDALIAFLEFRAELLNTADPSKPVKAFATPRTWEYVSDIFKDTEAPETTKRAMMSGAVGDGPATEFLAFVELIDQVVPIEEILANPEGVKISDKLDMQWATATNVAGHMTRENTDTLHRFLKRLPAETVVLAWTLALRRDRTIVETNAFLNEYSQTYHALFT